VKKLKKAISIVLTIALINATVPQKAAEASFISDFFGGLFTILTFPIAAIAPDNPTLRKNNPFRKKLWQIEAERKEEAERNFQRYLKQSPTVIIAPAPEPAAPQIPIGPIIDTIGDITKTIDQIHERIEALSYAPQAEKPLTVKDVEDIIKPYTPTRGQVADLLVAVLKKQRVLEPFNAAIKEVAEKLIDDALDEFKDNLKKELFDETSLGATNASLLMPAIQDEIDWRIEESLNKYHNKTVAPLLRPVKKQPEDFISDVIVKGSMSIVADSLVSIPMNFAKSKGYFLWDWKIDLLEHGIRLCADRSIYRIPSSTIRAKIVGEPEAKGWKKRLRQGIAIGGCAVIIIILAKTRSYLYWRGLGYGVAAAILSKQKSNFGMAINEDNVACMDRLMNLFPNEEDWGTPIPQELVDKSIAQGHTVISFEKRLFFRNPKANVLTAWKDNDSIDLWRPKGENHDLPDPSRPVTPPEERNLVDVGTNVDMDEEDAEDAERDDHIHSDAEEVDRPDGE
jgi:hypothetical protein